ncbi:tubulin polymerization-promoting protein family member 2 isoform X1 [Vulpes vulpes]|uniref:Tubulin polymerization-promoting protein family member 2 isoform X1 n=1 Tax=Vulpes vulpes TaxID=9627 RepID=A0A3Q7RRR3_VULVU|nr:tubulin polymerization-promoting protein family member 2 isoform X1 [Vulpes vulpes]XP_025847883.1 tubulin polymerization-promoting protein family member 2 isoform X1 [Vulpes vulpes]
MASEAGKTFQRFAVFGESSSSGTEMNNKNFSKLCRDCGIMDGKTVTSTDVDIVFSKVKAKNARTITFQQFQEAMKELGQKRFKDKKPDEALENVYKLMEGKDPATTGVTGASAPLLAQSCSFPEKRRRFRDSWASCPFTRCLRPPATSAQLGSGRHIVTSSHRRGSVQGLVSGDLPNFSFLIYKTGLMPSSPHEAARRRRDDQPGHGFPPSHGA